MNRIFIFILLVINLAISTESLSQGNNATLSGTVKDTEGNPLEFVNIILTDFPTIGTYSNRRGEYLLRIPAQRDIKLTVSSIGYKTIEHTIYADIEQRITWNITLEISDKELAEVQVTSQRNNNGNITSLDPRLLETLPNSGSGSIEALIKTLPGVSSNNELSSQYSVRGGNFDENLVYVNGIEVYRPFLVRSGQQEGLSFVNSDMVSSIDFSSGGFAAKYGDKMSSVLDIKYRKPDEFKGSASISMLGTSLHLEDKTLNGKLSHISGIRYKTNRYMLTGLDEEGEYKPDFIDFQTYITYDFSDIFDISFLGNITQNKYEFIPKTRQTTFGTWEIPLKATIYFDGKEVDKFSTFMGAISANYHPNNMLNLKFIASAYNTKEEVTYDILGQYYLNELERNMASENFADSVLNLGVGTFINYARNYLDLDVYSFTHQGAFNSENHLLNWGIKFNHEEVKDRINEWIYRDSTGYSIPYSDERVELYYTLNSKINIISNRLTAYIQDTYSIPVSSGDLYLNAGIRANYWDFNNELFFSPRISINYFPDWENNFSFRISAGIYNQSVFYKELKSRNGDIVNDIKAQKSLQICAGTNYVFTAWNRPFLFTSEIYYKHMPHLTPYQVDNVQIKYLPEQEARGYATGIDLKINGEFVSGVESWASLSLLKTSEDINDDEYGWIPRPTDQLFNFSLYFQDYLPGNPTYKMYMSAFYGSRLPVGPPNSERWQDTFRMPSYKRIDLGLSKTLISSINPIQNKIFSNIKEMWLSLEVFNLLNINNTISYFWVSSNAGDMFAVPNYLTNRKINLKLSVKF